MKHYSLEWAAKQNWRLVSSPKPFPGRWPTRLYVSLTGKHYLGKPHWRLPRLDVGQSAPFQPGDICVEFDRGGAVFLADYYAQEMRAERLFRFYHYWQQPSLAGEHLRTPVYPKRLGGWTVYSPYKTLKLAYIDQWKEFASEFTKVRRKRAVETPSQPLQPTPPTPPQPQRLPVGHWPVYDQVTRALVDSVTRRRIAPGSDGNWVYVE